jgi:gliding motility-associated-like protein
VTNYNAIVFGPEYSLDPYYADHYQLIFYDHLRLSDNSVIEFPSLNVSGDPCSGTVEITASGSFSGNSPYWYDDGVHLDKNGITVINQSVSQPESTIITVIDPENNTCVSTDLAELAFTGCETPEELSFPNVITSNGDGINDVYTIANLESVSSLSFKVLNRWGDVVYKSENYLNDWRPNDLTSGVYFYLAEISLLNGETSLRQGTVQIVSK